MPIQLNQFGPLIKTSSNSLDVKRGNINPVPQTLDPRIVEVGLNANIQVIGSQVSSVYEPVQNAVFQALQAAQQLNQLPSDILNQLNLGIDISSSLNIQIGQAINNSSSVAGGRYAMWGDQSGPQSRDWSFFSKNTGSNPGSDTKLPTGPQAYNLPRIAWQLTTELRRVRAESPIYFFVNPDTINYSQAFIEALDMVQKGYFITQWRDQSAANNFSCLKVNFNFQSSNLLPESYLDRQNPSSTLSVPPGLQNWYDLNNLFNEEKILDRDSLMKDGVKEEIANEYDGLPNYVYLSISTRVHPSMTLKGFFTAEINFSENAQDPLRFNVPLSFIAFDSDPHWYDMNELKIAYENFWNSSWSAESNTALQNQDYTAAPLPGNLAPIPSKSLDTIVSSETPNQAETAPPPIPSENEPEKIAPDLSTKDNNTILTGQLPGAVTQEKVLADGSKLTKTVDASDKYTKLENESSEVKKENITKASETGTSFQSTKEVDKASGSTTIEVTTEKAGNVVTTKVLNAEISYKDKVPPPWLPWNQYPPKAELMKMYPNSSDEIDAKRQYNLDRIYAMAELKQKVGQ